MDMHSEHFDIGTIQAFLDGELSHERVDRFSSHLEACDNCALMLSEAEEESAIVFPALEREFNSLVPTQRLWNKINDSIAIEKQNAPFWKKAWGYVSIAFASPSITAMAGMLIVFGLVAVLWMGRSQQIQTTSEVAAVSRPAMTVNSAPQITTASVGQPTAQDPKPGDTVSEPLRASGPRVERASYQPEARRTVATPAVYKINVNPNENGLPGEESYLKTIASLSKTVETQKDTAMRPSERVAYERDMAMVNDSIARMRQEVKRDPKNDSAKQVLYSSYQNKIDLLSSVSQKGELMASLR